MELSKSGVIVTVVVTTGFVLSTYLGGVGGCGCGAAATRGASGDDEIGSTGAGATSASVETVTSGVQSSVTSVLSSVPSVQGLRVASALKHKMNNKNETNSDEDCEFNESAGSFSCEFVTDCDGGGTATLSYSGTVAEETCDAGEGTLGSTFTMRGSMTQIFENCQGTATCSGEPHTVVMNGTMEGPMTSVLSECASSNFEVVFESTGGVESCNGLVITVDSDTTINTGIEMTLLGSAEEVGCESDAEAEEADVTISICLNDTTYASLEAVIAEQDPEGLCSSSESESGLVTKSVEDSNSCPPDASSNGGSICLSLDQDGIHCSTDEDCLAFASNLEWDCVAGLCDNTCVADSDCEELNSSLNFCGHSVTPPQEWNTICQYDECRYNMVE